MHNFTYMFKMLKILLSKDITDIFLPWGLHGLIDDEFAQFNFIFELIRALLAQNHFVYTSNILQSL
jgi:hypothetical protein